MYLQKKRGAMDRINWSRVRDILISLVCIGIIFWASWSIMGLFVHAIILLLLAMAIAFLVTPLVNLLSRSLPRILATLLVFVVILGVLGGLCYALILSLIQQIQYFSNNLPGYINDLPTTYATSQRWLVEQGIPQTNITEALALLQERAQDFLNIILFNAFNIAFFVTDVLINIMLVVVLSFYLTLDGKRIRDGLVGIAPKRSLPHVLLFEDALNRVVGNYIRGQLTLALLIGILAALGCSIFRLGNYALIVGVLAFLFETIPMVGPALASIPALLISLLLPDPFPRTIYILIYFICVQIVESNILGPRIVGHAVGLHPVASILALIVGAQLFGAFGALLATPIVGAVWVVITSLYRSLRGESADEILANSRRASWIRTRDNNNRPPPPLKRPPLVDILHPKNAPGGEQQEPALQSTRNTLPLQPPSSVHDEDASTMVTGDPPEAVKSTGQKSH